MVEMFVDTISHDMALQNSMQIQDLPLSISS